MLHKIRLQQHINPSTELGLEQIRESHSVNKAEAKVLAFTLHSFLSTKLQWLRGCSSSCGECTL